MKVLNSIILYALFATVCFLSLSRGAFAEDNVPVYTRVFSCEELDAEAGKYEIFFDVQHIVENDIAGIASYEGKVRHFETPQKYLFPAKMIMVGEDRIIKTFPGFRGEITIKGVNLFNPTSYEGILKTGEIIKKLSCQWGLR